MLTSLSQGRPKSSLSHAPTSLFLAIGSYLYSYSRGMHACTRHCLRFNTEGVVAFRRPDGPHQVCDRWIPGIKHPGSAVFEIV